jgi:hypothetical protein
VSKSTTGLAGSASRRAILLNTVSVAAGGFILSAPAARTALVTPASCKIVADPISPDGWCQFYGAKPG